MQVLIADEIHESLLPMLENIGLTFSYLPKITRAEILEIIYEYDGLIIRSKTKINNEFLTKASKLKFIARAGAGLDLIDIEETKKLDIALFGANEGNCDAVAEHTLGMALCLFNKINTANNEVKNGIWNREGNRGVELMGKTWGIIGYGNNGQATAKRLAGFGVNVLAYDRYRKNYSDNYAVEASMEKVFENANIISFHLPLTSATNQMVNDLYISQFKKNIYIINIARGEIVVLKDLLKNLLTGKITGACLDVLENEKISQLNKDQQVVFDALVSLPNTIFTPHIAGWTRESYVKINEVMVEKIKIFLNKIPK